MATATKSTTTKKKTTTAKPKTTVEKKPVEKAVAEEQPKNELVPYTFPLLAGVPDEQQYYETGINGVTHRWKRGEIIMLPEALANTFKRRDAKVAARRKSYEAFKKGSVQIG